MVDFSTGMLPKGDAPGINTVPVPPPNANPPPATPGASGPATGGGYDEAMKKLGITPQQPTNPNGSAPEILNIKEETEAMIDNISGLQYVLFSIYCMTRSVDKTPEIEKHLALTENEKKQLRTWGPSMVPHWKRLGLDKNIGPIIFCATLAHVESEHWKAMNKEIASQNATKKIEAEKHAAELELLKARTIEIEAKTEKVLARAEK